MSNDQSSPAVSPAPAEARRHVWLGAGGLVLAALAVYGNSLGSPFLFDDINSIARNPSLASPATWFSPPTQFSGVGGRPLLNASFGLNYALGGFNPLGYHLFNLAIHVTCGLLVFGLARRALAGPRLAARIGSPGTWLALGIAALWMLHPVQTESVTYISQRAESMMAACLLATVYGIARSHTAPRPRGWLAFAVVACAIGMTIKETMVVTPVVAWLFDATFLAGSAREAWRMRRRFYPVLAATWLLLAWLMMRSELGERGVGFGHGVTLGQNLQIAAGAISHYLRVAFWPSGLALDYGDASEMAGFVAWRYTVFVAALVVGVLVALRRWPAIGFLGCWFFGILAPTSSFVPIVGQPVAEHRVYLSLLAPIALVVWAAYRWRGGRGLYGIAALAVVAGGFTVWRNRDYRTAEAIWRDNIAQMPGNPRAYDHLAEVLIMANRPDDALAVVRTGLKLRPNYGWLHVDYAQLLQLKGDTEQALLAAQMAAGLMPGNLKAEQLLAQLALERGDLTTARDALEALLRADPGNGYMEANLSSVMRQLGFGDEALRHAQAAVRLAPDYFGARGNLAMALLDAGRVPEAIAEHEQWLRLQPGYTGVNHEFAVGLLKLGRFAEARAELEAMLRRNPDAAETHNYLGVALAGLSERELARAEFIRALRLRPDLKSAQENLESMGP